MESRRILLFTFLIALLFGLFYWFSHLGLLDLIQQTDVFKQKILALGTVGPLIIIGTIALAIVMSPIPSAPIALVSGAVYGHIWGTVYVLIGSTIGAVAAFLIARLLGYDALKHWIGKNALTNWLGSQNSLMGIVFCTRLIPILSFDIVSYAAGFTALSFWRFLIATVAGIAPASFLLAHFGVELSSADSSKILYAIVGLGILFLIPLVYRYFKTRRN